MDRFPAKSSSRSWCSWLRIGGFCLLVGQFIGAASAATFAVEDSFLRFDEKIGTATIRVLRTGATALPGSVRYATADVHATAATAGVDYLPASGTLLFGVGETAKAVTITIRDDSLLEGDELFNLVLGEPSAGDALGSPSNATVVIADNERPGTLLDGAFSPALDAYDYVQLAAPQADGKVVLSGYYLVPGTTTSYERLRRLNADGTIDPEFALSGGPDWDVFVVTPLAGGKLLIAGGFTNFGTEVRPGIARLNSDGSLDTSFDPGAGIRGTNAPTVFAVAVQGDGRILIGGSFESVAGFPRRNVARLNPDGSIDPSFDPGAGALVAGADFSIPWVGALAVQPDGRIVVGGQFVRFGATICTNLVRLNPDGSVDSSFVNAAATGTYATVDALALQSDGKIVVSGAFARINGVRRYGVARLNTDGSLDAGFDPGGGAVYLDSDGSVYVGLVSSLAVTPDQKIMLGGRFTYMDGFTEPGFARLNSDGTLDQTLDGSTGTTLRDAIGYVDPITVYSLHLQTDGRFVIAAGCVNSDGFRVDRVARLFSTNALTNTVEFQQRRTFLGEAAGTTNFTVIRRGESSSGFAIDYTVRDFSAVAGEDFLGQSGRIQFAPLETEKTIPIQIIQDGKAEADEQFNLVLQTPLGGAALGSPTTLTINLIDAERPGSLDMSFANVFIPFPDDPLTSRPVSAISLQTDKKIVFAGSFTAINGVPQAGVARLLPDGSLDPDFLTEFDAFGYPYNFFRMVIQTDGKVVGGYDGLARILPDGEYDAQYQPEVQEVWSLALQTDGRLLVGEGYFDQQFGQTQYYLTRLLSNGAFDSGFDVTVNGPITAIAVQNDGRIVIGGGFNRVNGVLRNKIARVLATGQLDTSFNPGSGISAAGTYVVAITSYPTNRVLVAGLFSSVNGVARKNMAMLTATGGVDPSFDIGTGPDSFVESIAVQSDGKIVIGGDFTSIAGVLRAGLARLNANGSLDSSFTPRLGFDTYVSVAPVVLQPDGRMIAGGLLNSVAGLRRSGLARIIGGDLPVQFNLQGAARSPDGLFRFSFPSQTGRIYAIQTSSDLSNWVQIDARIGSGSTITYQEPTATPTPTRYYRALLLP